MKALTPNSAGDLPPLGELVADDPFWRYPVAAMTGKESALPVSMFVWFLGGLGGQYRR